MLSHLHAVLMYSGDWWDDRFNFVDIRRECMTPRVHDAPLKTAGRAIGFFKGKMITCGGNVYGVGMSGECHAFEPMGGWTSLGTYPTALT